MKKMKFVVPFLLALLAIVSCNNTDTQKTDEEIVIGDENKAQTDSNNTQMPTATPPANAVSTKHPDEKIAEYDKKSKVNLQEVAKGEKGVSTRTKRYYYNENGTIVSVSEILHEDPKSDYVLFEKVGSADPVLKLMITDKTKDATHFKGDRAEGTVSKGQLKIAVDGSEVTYTAAN